jgi:tetratricopeptide (TPR) repeat protein
LDAYYNLGNAYVYKGEYHLAAKSYEKIIELELDYSVAIPVFFIGMMKDIDASLKRIMRA